MAKPKLNTARRDTTLTIPIALLEKIRRVADANDAKVGRTAERLIEEGLRQAAAQSQSGKRIWRNGA